MMPGKPFDTGMVLEAEEKKAKCRDCRHWNRYRNKHRDYVGRCDYVGYTKVHGLHNACQNFSQKLFER
jgi:hypothetical protein